MVSALIDNRDVKLPADASHPLFALSMRRKLRYLYDGEYFKYREGGEEFTYPDRIPGNDAYLIEIFDQKSKHGYLQFNATQDDPNKQPRVLEENGNFYASFEPGQYMDLYSPPSFTNIYSFGNSYTDTGNYPPDLFPLRQKVWVEYVAENYNFGIFPSIDSGNNFAWGGARLLETYTQSTIEIPSIKSQISSAGAFGENDLICFFGGGNDYLGASRDAAYILSGIKECLEDIVAKGGKNIVMLNMINLYRMPGVTDPNATQLSKDVNAGLNDIINSLAVNVYLVDAYTILEDAFTYGIYGVSEELFFDNFHIIDDVHELFARSATALIPNVNAAASVGKDFTITVIGDSDFPRPMISIFGEDLITIEPGNPTSRFTFNSVSGSISKNANNRINQLFSGVRLDQNNKRVITMKSEGSGRGQSLSQNTSTNFNTISIGRSGSRFFKGKFVECTMHLGDLSFYGAEKVWEEAKLVY